MRVNLIIGGAEKGGTTALHHLLNQHPSIVMPRAKELHFFSDDSYFRGSEDPDYDCYHKMFYGRSYPYKAKILFKKISGASIFGDATPDYMWWRSAPYRIYQYNPDAKWILLLRNPIERAFSHYKMEYYKKKREHLSFADALIEEERRSERLHPLQDKVFSYKSRGLYSGQLRNIYKYFDCDSVFVVTSDKLKHNMLSVLNDVCMFLGVSEYKRSYLPGLFDSNAGNNSAKISQNDKQYLVNIFRDDVSELENILDMNLSSWLM